MSAVELCRTAALGGHVERCADCAHTRVAYNSCRNRHCPKCQWRAAQAWLEAREAELLPVPYFHVVFTLPAALGALAYQNKARVYGLLLKAAAETLTTIAADSRHLGAGIGVTAVLQSAFTLGQKDGPQPGHEDAGVAREGGETGLNHPRLRGTGCVARAGTPEERRHLV